ncbi:hypothetical protein [Tardiphaga sp. 709]|uniref:hypothetical protein n=1 Tax=Tardiphaga sp. 709 TaxID=3076039 RepID=UPI0028E643A7|nr:hypothetical protein [Tardiphaga sp. 709]WNV10113.1 hypothetical protein RSO67_02635 [Tardiphaga sp. 709]
MTDDALYLMRVLADREDTRTAGKLADVICQLVQEGAENKLGALVERDVMVHGVARKSLTVPDEWFTRLADAVDRGAFEIMSAKAIAERILIPLPPFGDE